jgi:hypothetical protein
VDVRCHRHSSHRTKFIEPETQRAFYKSGDFEAPIIGTPIVRNIADCQDRKPFGGILTRR